MNIWIWWAGLFGISKGLRHHFQRHSRRDFLSGPIELAPADTQPQIPRSSGLIRASAGLYDLA